MKKYCWCFLLAIIICLTCSTAWAQESVGFSEPEDIQPLLDYRLPDWGYSNFWLDLDHRGNFSSTKDEFFDVNKRRQLLYDTRLNPRYNLFRESEARKLNVMSTAHVTYWDRNNRNGNDGDIDKYSQKRLGALIRNEISIRQYQSDDLFIYGGADLNVDYNRQYNQTLQNDIQTEERTTISRNVTVSPELGIGFGRIRNVTPLIRTIRLDERVRGLDQGNQLNRENLQNAAYQFTKYNGYQAVYDRPDKHFWQDMNQATGGVLSNQNPFDMMYLTDVLDEALGTRLEGWEVLGGLRFRYQNNLNRTEERQNQGSLQLNRNTWTSKEIELFTRGRWYRNLSLNHQLGLFGSASYSRRLGDDGSNSTNEKWNLRLGAGVNWLWSVADRWLADVTLSTNYSRNRLQRSFSVGSYTEEWGRWNNRISLGGRISYFILNQVSLDLNLNSDLFFDKEAVLNSPDRKEHELQLNYRLGLRYYFSRNLY